MSFYDSWRKFRDEPTLLREIDEEELDHIADFLRDMEEDDLPFPNLFGSDMRILIPFEKGLLPSRLERLEHLMGYRPNQPGSWEIDFDTGMMRREIWNSPGMKEGDRPIWMPVPLDKSFEKADKGHRAKLEKEGWRFKTQQMKIGKFLTKYKRMKEKVDNLNYPTTGGIDYDAVEAAQGELYDFAGSHFASRVGEATAQDMLDAWGQSGGKTKPLAIIFSRHPIDILRMSDYEHIQSCHSPKSRGAGEYYHCAVADAHGHGAIAYLVNKEQLEGLYDKSLDPGKYDRELYALDNEEIFKDKARDIDGIEPLARVRVRRYIYSKGDEDSPDSWTGEVAIPEARIYGPDVTGFREKVADWLKQNQEESIRELPDDLSKTALIGGTYYDTTPFRMFNMFLPDRKFEASPRILRGVENEIMSKIGSGTMQQYEEDIKRLNNAYAERLAGKYKIEGTPEDDGAGDVYIDVAVSVQFRYPLDDFKQLPSNAYASIEHMPEHFSDMGIDLFENGRAWIRKEGENVLIEIDFDNESLVTYANGFNVLGYITDTAEYEHLLNELTLKNNEYPQWEAEIEKYLQREGVMKGGAIFNLARDVEDDEFDNTGWITATDDGYMPGHVNAKLTGLKVPAIPENRYREFKIRLREEIIQAALDSGSEYMEYAKKSGPSYPNMWVGDAADTWTSSASIKSGEFELEFEVTDDDPDDVVNTLVAIILTVSPKTVQALAIRVAEEVLSDSERDAYGRRRRSLDEQIIDNWRAYLND